MRARVLLLCVALACCRRGSCSNRVCPELLIDSCHCTSERSREFSRHNVRVKVACDDADLMETMPPSSLPNSTVSLILSNNKISALRNNSFHGLSALEKLDLRRNLISRISSGAFRGLTSLRRLDLSSNRIGCFSPEMFLDLGRLSKLSLFGNIFSTLPEGLFTHLPSLRLLQVGSEYLYCDCQLRWLLFWVRGQNGSACAYPQRLQGLELGSLQDHQLTCAGPLELPVLQLIPSQKQLVFGGDRLPLQCTVSYLDPSVSLWWSHEQQPVFTLEEKGLYVEPSIIHDCCLLTSEIILTNIDHHLSGNWQCHVSSSRGNTSVGMEMVVLDMPEHHCLPERVSSNKGEFRWPKTLAGVIAFLPCAVASSGSAQQEKRAWRRCDRSGHWAEDDYNQCSYASEFTRSLHQLAQVPLNSSSVVMLAQQLRSLTCRFELFSDVMDVIFVTHLVERITRLVDRVREVSVQVLAVASDVMRVEERVLWVAQSRARACSRIVQCVERVAGVLLDSNTQSVSQVSANIALEVFTFRPGSVSGLLCTVVQRWSIAPPVAAGGHGSDHSGVLSFRCHVANGSRSPLPELSQNPAAVASYYLPLSSVESAPNSTCALQLVVFRNGKLFPCTGNSSNLADDGKRRSVSTPVAFTKLDGCSPGSPVQPVSVALRHFSSGVDPAAAYWDFELLDGHGGWRAEGCHITGTAHNTTAVRCARHENIAVLMDLKKGLSFPPFPGEFLHPVVYACTAVLLLCLFASIITYILHHSSIRISQKGWHMLLNFCFHAALTFAVFAGGINRVKHPVICQAVGMVLHYSSLSTMLWLGVTARNIYKQVMKEPQQPQQNGGPATPDPITSPMLRFYVVSAGFPFIICGITAAISLENYGSGDQTPVCWMAWEPSLGAFYGPMALVFLVTCIYFLCTFVQLHRHPERRYELKASSKRQCHHQWEAREEGGQCHTGCPGLISPAMLANEHSLKAQLRTAAFTLFLFIITWTFAALAVSQGPFLDMVFSCLYGAFAVTLGLFVLIHHCAKRDDVWQCWCACCPARQAPTPEANGDAHGHPDSFCGTPSHAHCGICRTQAPVSPCCAALRSQRLLADESTPHILLHADPEGFRPAVHLHRCSRYGTDRELTFHIPSGSAPASRANSPLSHAGPGTHRCCHHHELPLCHHHLCSAKDEPLSLAVCQPETGETGTFQCGCEKLSEEGHHAHMAPRPRRQSLHQNVSNHNGILKASALNPPPNIRTGPWKNETTV